MFKFICKVLELTWFQLVGLLNICMVILHYTLQLKISKVSQCWLTSTYVHINANTLLLYWAFVIDSCPLNIPCEVDSKLCSSPLCVLRNVCLYVWNEQKLNTQILFRSQYSNIKQWNTKMAIYVTPMSSRKGRPTLIKEVPVLTTEGS